jgi:hypothetical protein
MVCLHVCDINYVRFACKLQLQFHDHIVAATAPTRNRTRNRIAIYTQIAHEIARVLSSPLLIFVDNVPHDVGNSAA